MTAVASRTAGPGATRVRRGNPWRTRLTILAFLSPGIIGLAVFFVYPLAANLYYSFTRYDLVNPAQWAGFANYQFMFDGDRQIGTALRNTLVFCVVSVPVSLAFALGVASVLARIRSGAGIYRTLFYLPTLLPPVAAAMAFSFVLNPGTGPVNAILKFLGLPQPLWFHDPNLSQISLLMLTTWGVGNTIVIFLAAVNEVPQEQLEAAQIDGAGPLRRFWSITIPTISPVLLFATITGVIASLQLFSQPYVVSTVIGGGSGSAADNLGYPQNTLLFFTQVLYQQGFRYFNMGYAAALSMVLFAATLVVTVIMIAATRRGIHSEES
ncbi:carbohydrate ABC transporter permease [Herbiconiux sp. L3-i23]|uniref:carbohydrate ABC transporter permease n=1 Tax=Herbiconiux sp. L3-i23 TaxID=2905871 RepID=UPI00205F09C5|nr:sugar ABC transporter permease [Herbiconiux sp. L3-i23]BDI22177.1 sugar ABC transporter permease [Herbiconiux sp. L3-i23]